MDIDQSLDDRIAAARKNERPQRGRSSSDRRNVVGGGVGRRSTGGRDSPNNSGRNTPVNVRSSPMMPVSAHDFLDHSWAGFRLLVAGPISHNDYRRASKASISSACRVAHAARANAIRLLTTLFCLLPAPRIISALRLALRTMPGRTTFTRPRPARTEDRVVEALSCSGAAKVTTRTTLGLWSAMCITRSQRRILR